MNEFKAMAAEYGSSANGTHVKGVKFDMVRHIVSFLKISNLHFFLLNYTLSLCAFLVL